jgi:hypothetical protein
MGARRLRARLAAKVSPMRAGLPVNCVCVLTNVGRSLKRCRADRAGCVECRPEPLMTLRFSILAGGFHARFTRSVRFLTCHRLRGIFRVQPPRRPPPPLRRTVPQDAHPHTAWNCQMADGIPLPCRQTRFRNRHEDRPGLRRQLCASKRDAYVIRAERSR